MTDAELIAHALRLAEERTDGSQAALYLMAERMRPVLVALTETFVKAQLRDLRRITELSDERDEFRRRAEWWDNYALIHQIGPYGGQ